MHARANPVKRVAGGIHRLVAILSGVVLVSPAHTEQHGVRYLSRRGVSGQGTAPYTYSSDIMYSTDIRFLWYNGVAKTHEYRAILRIAPVAPIYRVSWQTHHGLGQRAFSIWSLPTMTPSQEWYTRVYHDKEEWDDLPLETRLEVIRRDKYCQVCEGQGKSIHHIVPRAEGGNNGLDNLILLCVKCHDEIELTNYRTRAEIEGHLPEWRNRQRRRHFKLNNPQPKPEPDAQTDWRLWVYGGYRNPRV